MVYMEYENSNFSISPNKDKEKKKGRKEKKENNCIYIHVESVYYYMTPAYHRCLA